MRAVAASFFVVMALLCFLCLPSRWLAEVTGVSFFSSPQAYTLCFLLPLLSAVALTRRTYLNAIADSIQSSEKLDSWNPQLLRLAQVLGVVIFLHICLTADRPLSVDEAFTGISLKQHSLYEILFPDPRDVSLLTNTNHTLANVGAWVSIRLWGADPYFLRLPNLFWSALFLGMVCFWVPRYFSAFSTFLLLGHVGVSRIAWVQMFTAKGYISMMACTLGLFLTLMSLLRGRGQAQWWQLGFFSLFSLGCILSHSFGGLIVLCFSSVLFFEAMRGSSFRPRAIVLLQIGALLTPLLLWTFWHHYQVLQHIGDLNALADGSFGMRLMQALGLSHHRVARAVLLLFGLGMAIQWQSQRKETLFTTKFLLFATVFVTFVVWAFEVRVLRGRFFLGFVPIVVLWLGEGVAHLVRLRVRAWAMSFSVLLLVVAPIYASTDPLFERLIVGKEDWPRFLRIAASSTEELHPSCFRFSGHSYRRMLAKEFYFSDRYDWSESSCKKEYVIHLGVPRGKWRKFWEGASLADREEQSQKLLKRVAGSQFEEFHRIYRDRSGNHLYVKFSPDFK